MARKLTEGWDEVFKAGPCVDSAGRPHDFTQDDLDKIILKYNDGTPHTAAVTIGHPTGPAPAYGWVAKLKREGDVLLAKYSEVDPAFEEALQAGRFKKKSVGLRDDYGIDHVAYLGAQAPAIKGLKDYQFTAAADIACYEFQEDDASVVELLGNWLLRKLGPVFSASAGQPIAAIAANTPAAHETCSAGDSCTDPNCCQHEHYKEKKGMEQKLKLLTETVAGLVAAQEANNKLIAAFAETTKAQGETIGKLQIQLTSGEEAAARRQFEEYCDSPELRTRITPAMKPGIVDALMLSRKGVPIEFEEGGEKKSVTAVDDYKARLKALPEVVQFGEFAGKGRGGHQDASAGDAVQMARKVTEFIEAEQKAGRTVTYATALIHVESEAKGGKK